MKPACVESDEALWTFALPLDDLWEGEMIGLCLEADDVLLVRFARDEIRAYDNHCPHAGARLSEGHLTHTTLRCPIHHWEFDVRSGNGVNPRNCKLRSFPVKLVDGAVLVQLRVPGVERR